jgi:glycopeptide antibiotics resistance protein
MNRTIFIKNIIDNIVGTSVGSMLGYTGYYVFKNYVDHRYKIK